MTPFSLRRTFRVSSAPANVTRQVTQSVEQHVQRLHRARQQIAPKVAQLRKQRPQSSPAHLRTSVHSGHTKPSPLPMQGSIVIKDDLKPAVKPDPLPNKHRWHGVTRGRSAPAIRAEVLPGRERGWTTSANDVMLPHNKLMPTAAQAREHVRRRPQSADSPNARNAYSTKLKNVDSAKLKDADSAKFRDVDSAKLKNAESGKMEIGNTALVRHSSSVAPRTTSCLNLKTCTKEVENGDTTQRQWPRRKRTINKTQRPLTCMT